MNENNARAARTWRVCLWAGTILAAIVLIASLATAGVYNG